MRLKELTSLAPIPLYKGFLDNKVRLTQKIENLLMVQSLDKVIRNEILIPARVIGAGLRQLARLTGVSFGVIQKCCKDQK